ncbi:MOSC domain-containing protein [Pseudalkalibacillus caeni]|uniref:MOSC domain-containing protein n=1 Tax=Exobacillus caeni TaxID=2574798 RepID=A0A5R9F6K7_9BACL|nr:MOSC N-terminal beta barrel domain-containing protein [Pseudalkalibacillus caeni]TLS36124.1 MOSC domain-containing protein [Pseudalkalibacillus caeni]
MGKAGKLQTIMRHPVKSFSGESVQSVEVKSYGVYGDRSHAFMDETRPGKYLTATQAPGMIGYSAVFKGEEKEEEFPEILIKTPEGTRYSWQDNLLKEEMERLSGRKVKPVKYSPSHVPIGAIEEENILIVTLSSLKKMEELIGKRIDHRRFRANLVLDLEEDIPFQEETWYGKKLVFKEVELKVERPCERCSIINIDPEENRITPEMLKNIYKYRDNIFGVYASVKRTGRLSRGEAFSLV